jgi:nucleoside-diphosphate-sugar epimerase
MARALVTGASGFIGRLLVEELSTNGWSVVSAGRSRSSISSAISHLDWSLGHPLGDKIVEADVIFHCASATISARADVEQAMRLDVSGTQLLVEQCRRVSKSRSVPALFVFISSQSASPAAKNAYGRSKYAIEQLLTGPDEVIVRPGLVYDETNSGVYGRAVRLIHFTRIIPKFSTKPCIQPIHVEDLTICLTRIANLRSTGTFCLGRETPLDFVAFCRRVAERENLPAPFSIPLLGTMSKLLLSLCARAGVLTNFNERVQGLIALEPMETSTSLARLGVRLRNF